MNKILKTSAILLVFFLCSCENDFEEINTNPNLPTDVSAEVLLRNILHQVVTGYTEEGWYHGNVLIQLTNFNGSELPTLLYNMDDNSVLWDLFYQLLRDTEILMEKAKNESQSDIYQGPSLVIKSFIAAVLTDTWGDVPYFEASKGRLDNNFTPKFDTQESIYMSPGGILDNLRQASTILADYRGGAVLSGDVVYNGDLSKWLKLSNSLRLRYLMRISNREDVGMEMDEILNSGQYIRNNTDNAVLPYLNPPNEFPPSSERVGNFTVYMLSSALDSTLKALNDPRIDTWFRPTEKSVAEGNPVFKGLRNGATADTEFLEEIGFSNADVSIMDESFRENDNVFARIMTSAEVHFILAEAVARNIIQGDAREFYEKGIEESFSFWNTALPVDYLSGAGVAFAENGFAPLNQIITQRWLSSFNNGYEGWFVFRRTGLPGLRPALFNVNEDRIPVRFLYPASEKALNAENYDMAVSEIGVDDINVRNWWETR